MYQKSSFSYAINHEAIRSQADSHLQNSLLYSEISSINDCTRLHNDINYLFNWSETWLLQINPAKCMHLWITNVHNYIKFTYCLGSSIIKEVPPANYLALPSIQGLLDQTMLQGLSPKQIQFWLPSTQLKVLPIQDQSFLL